MSIKFPFVVLAGSPEKRDSLMEYADTDYKTLIEVNGKPMLNYVLEAVIASERASHILVVGVPEDMVDLPDGIDPLMVSYYHIEGPVVDKIYGSGKELLRLAETNKNIFVGGNSEHSIYINGDIPAITPRAIVEFIDAIGTPTYEYYHSVVHKKTMNAMFPGSGRSWIHIKGKNDYCGGDLDMGNINTLVNNYELIKLLTESRKLLIKGLFKLSPFFFFRYIFRRVDIEEAEDIMTKIFGMTTKVIVSPYAEIAFDVDKPFQLDQIRAHMNPNQI